MGNSKQIFDDLYRLRMNEDVIMSNFDKNEKAMFSCSQAKEYLCSTQNSPPNGEAQQETTFIKAVVAFKMSDTENEENTTPLTPKNLHFLLGGFATSK